METTLKIIQIIAAFCVGGAAVWVSYLQYKINTTKLRLELYDQRIRVHKAVTLFLYKIIHVSGVKKTDCFDFWNEVSETKFLFNDKIHDHVQYIFKSGLEISSLEKKIDKHIRNAEDATKESEELFSLQSELVDKHDEYLSSFEKYLKLG